jgi:O-antigen ligase
MIAWDAASEVFKTILFVGLLTLAVRTERQMSFVMTACVLGVLHAGFLSVLGGRLGYVPNIPGRGAAVLPDPQQAVMVCFMPLLILIAMMRKGLERWFAWAALPFALDSIVGTYERTGFVCLAAQGALLLLFLPRRITWRLSPVLTVAVVLFVFRFTPEDYWSRMATIRTPDEEASAHSRFVVNEASWRILGDYPWGVGYRNYPYVAPRYLPPEFLSEGLRAAHNSYFSVLDETGIQGFVFWISAFLGAVWLLRRIRKKADPKALTPTEIYAMGTELGLYGWMVGGLFQGHHEVDPAYWFVGFAVILTRLHHQQKSSEKDAVTAAEELVRGAPVGQSMMAGHRLQADIEGVKC